MAIEDCLEVCFVRLVVGENYIWYFIIVFIFMGFGQAGAKHVGDALNSSNGGSNATQKGGDFL